MSLVEPVQRPVQRSNPSAIRLWGSPNGIRARRCLAMQAIAGLVGCLAWAAFAIDSPASTWLRSWDLPGDLHKAIQLSEAFAHGFGAAAILGCCLLVSRTETRAAVWLAVAITLSSGLLANGLKSCFARVRPHAAASIAVEASPPATAAGKQVVAASFWDARQRSFPSGHAATAWGLAIGLSLAFPRGWWLFGLLASLASVQRMVSGAHYPSDVLAGTALAIAVSGLFMLLWPVLERRLSRHRRISPAAS